MAYEPKAHGYAQTKTEIANAIEFCNALGDDRYDYTMKFMDCLGVIPDWLAAKMRNARAPLPWRKYAVSHGGREIEVVAKSEAAAINQARFIIYGKRPLNTLSPFSARLVAEAGEWRQKHAAGRTEARLTRTEIAARIRRMAVGL